MDESYRHHYQRILTDMTETPDEIPWKCSDIHLFGKLESFNTRLNKLMEIMEVLVRYSILDSIKIAGMQVYGDLIEKAYETISCKNYDPLEHRRPEFDMDYNTFQLQIDAAEGGMQKFLKVQLERIPNSVPR